MEVEFPDDQEDNAPDLGDTSDATGAALGFHFPNQGIQFGCSSGFEIVHRRTDVANGVKLVKRDSGIGQMHC